MKKRTLEEEIRRIKKINELFADDNDDYLYDPEYYEYGFEDETSEPEDPEDENGFGYEHSMDILPNQGHDVFITEPNEPEVSEEPKIPKGGIHHYDREKTDQLHSILLKGDLELEMIDEPVLQKMIKDYLVKETANFGGNERLFGFNLETGQGLGREIEYTPGVMKVNRSIVEDKNKFYIYVNNLIDIYNKRISNKVTPKDVGHLPDRWGHINFVARPDLKKWR